MTIIIQNEYDPIKYYKHTFGNAKRYVHSTDNFDKIPYSNSYNVIINDNDPNKLYKLLKIILKYCPEIIEIYADSYNKRHVLQDYHVALLSKTPIVGIPGHTCVTDTSLDYLKNAKCIEISGCPNITGINLPELKKKDNLLRIKTWGWGTGGGITKEILEWINNNCKY